MRNLLLIALMLVASQPSHADSKALREKEQACGEFGSYRQISGCFSQLLEETDAELNSQYRQLIEYLDPGNRKRLVAAQRAWVKFRDADCAFEEPRKDDDALVTAGRSICRYRITVQRLEQLESFNSGRGCNGCAW